MKQPARPANRQQRRRSQAGQATPQPIRGAVRAEKHDAREGAYPAWEDPNEGKHEGKHEILAADERDEDDAAWDEPDGEPEPGDDDLDDDLDDEPEDDEDDDDEDEDAFYAAESERNEHTAASYLAGQMIPLPSGGSIRVRPFSIISAIQASRAGLPGGIPNSLLAAAEELTMGPSEKATGNRAQRRAAGQAGRSDGRSSRQPATEDAQLKLIDWLCCKIIASFKVVPRPQSQCRDGEVSVARIYEADKLAILSFVMRGQEALAGFRS